MDWRVRKLLLTTIGLLLLGLTAPGKGSAAYSAAILARAQGGEAKAQVILGDAYWRGAGVREDPEAACRWFRLAAQAGYARGQRPLGVCYELGRGVEKNLKEAALWYEKAAAQGLARAQVNLAILFESGQGVEQDYQKARLWYKRAADQGYGRGLFKLGRLYERGLGVEPDLERAAELYKRGAEAGYRKAMVSFADLSANREEAQKWYKRAAALGSAEAKRALGRFTAHARSPERPAASSQARSTLPKLHKDVPVKRLESEKAVANSPRSVTREAAKDVIKTPVASTSRKEAADAVSIQDAPPNYLRLLFVGSSIFLALGMLGILFCRRGRGRPSAAKLDSLRRESRGLRQEIEEISRQIILTQDHKRGE